MRRPVGLARLAVVGMGLDEHPRPNARVRNLAANFGTIVEGIEPDLAHVPGSGLMAVD